MTSLVKKLDQVTKEGADKRLHTYLVVIGKDEDLEARAKAMVEKEKIANVAVSMSPKDPGGYKIPADAQGTMFFFVKQSAIAVGTFKKGETDETAVTALVDSIAAKTELPFPVDYYAPSFTPEKAIKVDGFGSDKAARGPNPCVIVFARNKVTPAVEKVIAKMEAISAENKDAKLDPFVVVVDPAEKAEADLQDLAKKLELKNTTLTTAKREQVTRFKVSKANDVTVMFCANGVAKAVTTFNSANFDQAAMTKLVADMDKSFKDRAAKAAKLAAN